MQTAIPISPVSSRITEIIEIRGWILYDSRCPLCRRGARRLGGVAVRRGFRLMPLQRRWVRELLPQSVADEMLLLLPGGRLLGGVDAYIHLAARVWWATPLAALASIPGLNFMTRRLYTWIASNRLGISRACGLDQCRISRAGP